MAIPVGAIDMIMLHNSFNRVVVELVDIGVSRPAFLFMHHE